MEPTEILPNKFVRVSQKKPQIQRQKKNHPKPRQQTHLH